MSANAFAAHSASRRRAARREPSHPRASPKNRGWARARLLRRRSTAAPSRRLVLERGVARRVEVALRRGVRAHAVATASWRAHEPGRSPRHGTRGRRPLTNWRHSVGRARGGASNIAGRAGGGGHTHQRLRRAAPTTFESSGTHGRRRCREDGGGHWSAGADPASARATRDALVDAHPIGAARGSSGRRRGRDEVEAPPSRVFRSFSGISPKGVRARSRVLPGSSGGCPSRTAAYFARIRSKCGTSPLELCEVKLVRRDNRFGDDSGWALNENSPAKYRGTIESPSARAARLTLGGLYLDGVPCAYSSVGRVHATQSWNAIDDFFSLHRRARRRRTRRTARDEVVLAVPQVASVSN